MSLLGALLASLGALVASLVPLLLLAWCRSIRDERVHARDVSRATADGRPAPLRRPPLPR